MKHLKDLVKLVAGLTEEQKNGLFSKTLPMTPEGHPLSLRNTMLLHYQSPVMPTIVTGFRAWLNQGRSVKKGEKAMWILIPCFKKHDDGETSTFFREAAVFDITQTEEIVVQ